VAFDALAGGCSIRLIDRDIGARRMTRSALRLIFTAALIVCAADAVACSCADVTLASRYESSASVFMAVVVDEHVEPADERTPARFAFSITETFKGRPAFAELASRRSDGVSCGIALRVGVEYLFFAPESGEIGLCSGTVKREGAERQIAALRSFVSGHSQDLAEPWIFVGPSENGCSLATRFDIAAEDSPGHLEISTSKQRGAQAPAFDATELTIRPGRRIPNGRDEDPRPLSLTAGERAYAAAWTTGRVLQQAGFPAAYEVPDSYVLSGADVEALLSELTMSRALHARYDSNGFGPSFDFEVRTTNLGDAGVRMLDCAQSKQNR
jgi:hypothetical protein